MLQPQLSLFKYGHKSYHLFSTINNKLLLSEEKCPLLRLNGNKNELLWVYSFFEKSISLTRKTYATKNKCYDLGSLKDCNFSTNNHVYVRGDICDIIYSLCQNKDIKAVSANLIFFILKHLDTKNVATSDEYKNSIKKIYFELITCYHIIFKKSYSNGEILFSIFNDDTIKFASPSLKRRKKIVIQEIVLNSLEFYFKNNINNKNQLNINLLCEVIKYKKFLYVLNFINYDKHQLKEKLNVKNIDYLFYEFLNDKRYLTNAIKLASLFYSEHMNINQSFAQNSMYNCLELLKSILKFQSNSLFLFLDSIRHDHLKRQVLLFLLSVNPITGHVQNYWGYFSTKEYLHLNRPKVTENHDINKEEVNDDTLKKQNKVYSNNPNSEYYNLPNEMKKILLINNANEFKKLMKTIKHDQEEYWMKNVYNNVDAYNTESNDNIFTMEDINNNLRHKKKGFCVAIDVEWNKDQKVSIISISTTKQIYIVDLMNIDYNYKLLMHSFFKFLFENPFIYKLFYNFSSDMKRISSYFQTISDLNMFINVIDLKLPLYMHIKCDKKEICDNNKIFHFEALNRDIIEKNNIDLFKKVTSSNFYNYNNQIKNSFNNVENSAIIHKKNKKLHFKSLNDLCQNFLKKKTGQTISII